MKNFKLEIPGVKGILRVYQKHGVAHLERLNGNALLADEMGLGKTVQVIAWVALHEGIDHIVIACPLSVKLQWKKEFKKWCPSRKVELLSGKTPYDFKCSTVILNYDIIAGWKKKLKKGLHGTNLLVLDECHRIKNPKAKRTKAVMKMRKKFKHIIGVSGTPITDRPYNLYTIIQLIRPSLFPNFFRYAINFCDAKHTRWGWDFSGAKNTKTLNKILKSTIMIRRLKKDVIKELPAKTRTVIPMDIENRREYCRAENNFGEWLRNSPEAKNKVTVKSKVEALMQLCLIGKMDACFSWLDDFLETGKKLVVFATHHKTVDLLMKRYKKNAVQYDGRCSSKEKDKAKHSFIHNRKINLFCANLQAAGVGIDGLQEVCSDTCHIELGWSPGDLDQADDRVHRIGQKADAVNAYYLIADGTIESEKATLLDRKRKVLLSVLDGVGKVSKRDLLTALIRKYKRGKQ